MNKLPEYYFCLNDMTPQHEVEECIIQECESAGLEIREDEELAEERGYDRAFKVVNPYKDKLKNVLKICKINAKRWDADQHDGKAEFKTICNFIEDKGWFKK